jgi:hypothetical protein
MPSASLLTERFLVTGMSISRLLIMKLYHFRDEVAHVKTHKDNWNVNFSCFES